MMHKNLPVTGRPVLLDGGMGHLLRRFGVEISGPVGSTQRFLGVANANLELPHLVVEAHMQFLRAGATVITTNNYSCVPNCLRLVREGDGPHAHGKPVDRQHGDPAGGESGRGVPSEELVATTSLCCGSPLRSPPPRKGASTDHLSGEINTPSTAVGRGSSTDSLLKSLSLSSSASLTGDCLDNYTLRNTGVRF